MAARRPTGQIPTDHRSFRGAFDGVTEDGMTFRLEVRDRNKRLGSAGLVKAHLKSMTRGRPMTTSDMYEKVVEIVLYVPDRHRSDIEVLPSGMYRHGRHADRSLRALVSALLDDMAPRAVPGP